MVKEIPLDKLMISSGSPEGIIFKGCESFKYVETRFPNASINKYMKDGGVNMHRYVIKNRNEPC